MGNFVGMVNVVVKKTEKVPLSWNLHSYAAGSKNSLGVINAVKERKAGEEDRGLGEPPT